jgi:hypothetical protein
MSACGSINRMSAAEAKVLADLNYKHARHSLYPSFSAVLEGQSIGAARWGHYGMVLP